MFKKYLLVLSVLVFAVASFVGCNEGDKVENMLVPRLMLESRNLQYGAIRGIEMQLPISRTKVIVDREALVSEFDIINVELVKVDMGMALMIQTNDMGARALYRSTVTNMGGRVVFTTNNQPIGARRIDGIIEDGKFFTVVENEDDELGQLVRDLKASIAELQTR